MQIEHLNNMLYSLDEICLIPAKVTNISHRSECNPSYENKMPIYIAPMTPLVDTNNVDQLNDIGFSTILPRSINFDERIEYMKKGYCIAVGLKEAEHLYGRFSTIKIQNGSLDYIPKICIDQANGHMNELLKICKKLKSVLGQNGIWIMTGNIANPNTYYAYAEVGIDAVRIGIGGGNVCTTSVQTGIHYPMASLIVECNNIKKDIKKYIKNTSDADIESIKNELLKQSIIDIQNKYKSVPLIIADGGFKRIDQIIKALALGADYVMVGEIIAKGKEACGKITTNWHSGELYEVREYYGMSTERAQLEFHDNTYSDDNIKYKHSEGISKYVIIEYSLKDWKSNFNSSLKSAMSYTNHKNLEDFVGNVDWDIMSNTSFNNYFKSES